MVARRVIAALTASLSLGLIGMAAPAVADPQTLIVDGFVSDQECQGGDLVRVTLDATWESSSEVRFKWDTNGDGRPDTPWLADPTRVVTYPDEVNRTVTVGARNLEGNMDLDTFSFATLRCEG